MHISHEMLAWSVTIAKAAYGASDSLRVEVCTVIGEHIIEDWQNASSSPLLPLRNQGIILRNTTLYETMWSLRATGISHQHITRKWGPDSHRCNN